MTEKAVRVVITGRVQGVWFRGWTVDEARSRGLSGWVRNRTDGTVEAVFAGEPAQVDEMVRACRDGPSMARVDDIRQMEEPRPPSADAGFEQRPTV